MKQEIVFNTQKAIKQVNQSAEILKLIKSISCDPNLFLQVVIVRMVNMIRTRINDIILTLTVNDKNNLKLLIEIRMSDMYAQLSVTSLEDLGAATCKLVNFVDYKVQSPLRSFGSPSEILQKSSRSPVQLQQV